MTLVRAIREQDNAVVADLIRTSLKEFGLDKPGTAYFDPQLDHLSNYYQEIEKAEYFVVEDEGDIVGCGGFAPISDEVVELQKLYVTQKRRGKGYSSALLKTIFHQAKLAGFKNIYLETSSELATAVSVYEHYGFKRLSKSMIEDGSHDAMDIWMIKPLT